MGTILDSILASQSNKSASPEPAKSTTLLSGILTGSNSGHATDVQLGQFGVGESKYDTNITPENVINLEKIRGEKQGWGAELGNAIGGGIAKIPFSVIGNVASILDFEDYYNQDKEVGNRVTAWAEEVKGNIEDATKIYKSNDNTLGSREWWMNNGKGLIDSAGGFVLTGSGLGKGLQLLSALSKGSKIVQGISTVANAVMLNQAESVPIAMKVYDDAIKMGKSEQDAADAAAYAININRLTIPLNLTSSFAFLRPIAATREVAKKFSRKEALGELLHEGAQEYLEEDINMIAENEALRKAKEGNKYAYDFDRTVSDVFSREGFEQGIVGFLGGVAQTGLTDLVSNMQKDSPSYDPEGNIRVDDQGNPVKVNMKTSMNERFIAQQNSLKRIETLAKTEGVNTVKETLDKIKVTARKLNDIQIAALANDTETVDKLKNDLLTDQALDAFKNGTTEQLLQMYKSIQSDPNSKESLGEDFHAKAGEAISQIESLEKIYQKHSHLPQVSEVFKNRAEYLYNTKRAETLKRGILQAKIEQSKEIENTGFKTPELIESLSTTQELKSVEKKFLDVQKNIVKLHSDYVKILDPSYTPKPEQDEEKKTEPEPTPTPKPVQGDAKPVDTTNTSTDNTSSNPDLDNELAAIDEAEQKAMASPKAQTPEGLKEIQDKYQKKREEAEAKYKSSTNVVPEDNTAKIEEFVDRISKGEKLSTPEDLQFYENNKEDIESRLKSKQANTVKDTPDKGQVLDATIDYDSLDSQVRYIDPIFDTQELTSRMIARTVSGQDDDTKPVESRYFNFLRKNRGNLPAGSKLMVVTRNNNKVIFEQIMAQKPAESAFEAEYEKKNKKPYPSIYVVLVDANGKPILSDQDGNMVKEGDATNYVIGNILSPNAVEPQAATGRPLVNVTNKKEAKKLIADTREKYWKAKTTFYLPVVSISRGVDIREKTETDTRRFNPVQGHITNDITNPDLLQLAKVGPEGKNVVLKNGQIGRSGRLYGFTKDNEAFDLIPRKVLPEEVSLLKSLIMQRLGIGPEVAEDASAEIDKLIFFGIPKEGPDKFTIGIKAGMLQIGDNSFTIEEFAQSKEAQALLDQVLTTKLVNVNTRIAFDARFMEPVLTDRGVQYREWDSYQEFLLSNEDGRVPFFGTDLPALDKPRFRSFYMNYGEPAYEGIKVDESKDQAKSGDPVATDVILSGEPKAVKSDKLFDPSDKTLKKGSVVDYNGKSYLFWKENKGKAQLINTDGTKFSGTPAIDKLTVKGAYKTTKYAGTEYIVTDNDNIYSGATGKLVFTAKDKGTLTKRGKVLDAAKAQLSETKEVKVEPMAPPDVVARLEAEGLDNKKDYKENLDNNNKSDTFVEPTDDDILMDFEMSGSDDIVSLDDKTISGEDIEERKKHCE